MELNDEWLTKLEEEARERLDEGDEPPYYGRRVCELVQEIRERAAVLGWMSRQLGYEVAKDESPEHAAKRLSRFVESSGGDVELARRRTVEMLTVIKSGGIQVQQL